MSYFFNGVGAAVGRNEDYLCIIGKSCKVIFEIVNYPGIVGLWKVGFEKPINLVLGCKKIVVNHTASVKWWFAKLIRLHLWMVLAD